MKKFVLLKKCDINYISFTLTLLHQCFVDSDRWRLVVAQHLHCTFAAEADQPADNTRLLPANRRAFQRVVTRCRTLENAASDLSLHWNLSSDQRRKEARREYGIRRLILYSATGSCDKRSDLIAVCLAIKSIARV